MPFWARKKVPEARAPLENKITLGGTTLCFDNADGQWSLENGVVGASAEYRKEIERRLEGLTKRAEQNEQTALDCSEYLQQMKRLSIEVDRLKFKNAVLAAMLTISEGDYTRLCKDANYKPRDKKLGEHTYSAPEDHKDKSKDRSSPPQQAPASQSRVRVKLHPEAHVSPIKRMQHHDIGHQAMEHLNEQGAGHKVQDHPHLDEPHTELSTKSSATRSMDFANEPAEEVFSTDDEITDTDNFFP